MSYFGKNDLFFGHLPKISHKSIKTLILVLCMFYILAIIVSDFNGWYPTLRLYFVNVLNQGSYSQVWENQDGHYIKKEILRKD